MSKLCPPQTTASSARMALCNSAHAIAHGLPPMPQPAGYESIGRNEGWGVCRKGCAATVPPADSAIDLPQWNCFTSPPACRRVVAFRRGFLLGRCSLHASMRRALYYKYGMCVCMYVQCAPTLNTRLMLVTSMSAGLSSCDSRTRACFGRQLAFSLSVHTPIGGYTAKELNWCLRPGICFQIRL